MRGSARRWRASPRPRSGSSTSSGTTPPWAQKGGGKEKHTGRISVIAANEPGALANLTNAIAKQDGAISNLKVINRQQDFFEALVDVDVRDVAASGHRDRRPARRGRRSRRSNGRGADVPP